MNKALWVTMKNYLGGLLIYRDAVTFIVKAAYDQYQ